MSKGGVVNWNERLHSRVYGEVEPAALSDEGVHGKRGDAELLPTQCGLAYCINPCKSTIVGDGVDDFPAGVFDGASAGIGQRQQGFQELPFGVVEV